MPRGKAKATTGGDGVTALVDPTNGADFTTKMSEPYVASVTIRGVADYLFHRWNVEAIEAKSKAAKGSEAKKTDNVESYVYRDSMDQDGTNQPTGLLCIPGEQIRMALVGAAKYKQDPRSPRKAMTDLAKAGLMALTPLAVIRTKAHPTGSRDWDYLHKARVQVQRNGITRTRPAMLAGWEATFEIACGLPEYIPPPVLNELLQNAGRLQGIGNFRPTYGRFQVTHFEVVSDD